MNKTLYLEKRGCDFFGSDEESKLSDVGNYRVCTNDYIINGKDGNKYFIEFGGYTRKNYRTTNKRTGAKLKKTVVEIAQQNALYIDLQFVNERGTWGNIKLEQELAKKQYSYTLCDILKAVNDIGKDTYTSIEFV